MGKKKKEPKEYAVIYQKNQKYKQEDINKLIRIYHLALDAEDNQTVQDTCNRIYEIIEKYVYKTLWSNYRTLMKNPNHREDIIQEVWIKIFSELKKYDPDKGAITTFIAPWIKHVVAEYTSKNFKKTSVYYASAMQKVNGAQNYAKQYGLNPDDIDLIMNLTGLSEATVKSTIDIMQRKDYVSYEALVDVGADYISQIKGPEESVLDSESEKDLYDLLHDILSDDELLIITMLLNPENDEKKHSSYREIADQIPGSNIPKIKRQVSRIVSKLKNNKRFGQLYPYIISQEKALENNFLPILDSENVSNEIEDAYKEFYEKN